MNKDNLLVMAAYLDTLPQSAFDMGNFRSHKDGGIAFYKNQDDCGTVGCVIGCALFVKGLEPIESDMCGGIANLIDFGEYCERIFRVTQGSILWEFLFGGSWAEHDNTPSGAATRIRYALSEELDLESFVKTFEEDCQIQYHALIDTYTSWAAEQEGEEGA